MRTETQIKAFWKKRSRLWGTLGADGTFWPETSCWNGRDDVGTGETYVYKVGKKHSGAMLDGKEYRKFPCV